MKNKILLSIAALIISIPFLYARDVDATKYKRSSIYSFMLERPDKRMATEIRLAFLKMDTPDKYNNHNLSVRYVIFPKDKKQDEERINNYLQTNQIAKRMVAKWFNRQKENGAFDMTLVGERGMYNASVLEKQLAEHTIRGAAALSDAGEELIANTFVLVNDISYIDKQENADIAAQVFGTIASVVGSLFGAGNIGNLIKATAQLAQAISKMVAGFTVKTTTYLYKLEWNDEIAATFYQNYYYEQSNIDLEKKKAFEADSTLFKLSYIGKYSASSQKTVMRGLYEPADVFRKVCTRAIDKNVMELQKKYDVFKVKVPITEVSNVIKAPIGLKEGISPSSKFEVLESKTDADGRTKYNRVGIIRPVEGKIWDNRYMSDAEGSRDAKLGYTVFEKESSTSNFYAGMLIREIK